MPRLSHIKVRGKDTGKVLKVELLANWTLQAARAEFGHLFKDGRPI